MATSAAPDPIFAEAVTKFQANLTRKQRQDFSGCTKDDVVKAIRHIQDVHGSQRRMRNMKKISRFIEAMNQLGQVAEVFLNVTEVVAFLWVLQPDSLQLQQKSFPTDFHARGPSNLSSW